MNESEIILKWITSIFGVISVTIIPLLVFIWKNDKRQNTKDQAKRDLEFKEYKLAKDIERKEYQKEQHQINLGIRDNLSKLHLIVKEQQTIQGILWEERNKKPG